MNISSSSPVFRAAAVAALCVVAACDSSVQPRAIPPVVPTETGSALFVVSSPVHPASGLASVSAQQTTTPTVAYVSMAPGSIPNGSSATLSVERTRATVFALLTDGGLDPVPIAAVAGDTIAVAVQTFAGALIVLRIPVPPAAPPVIVRTDPPKQKRDVPLNARIVIVFSEPIDVASLTGTVVELHRNGARVPGRLSFIDGVHTGVQFEPTDLLERGADYTLTVTQGIRNVSGMALQAPASVQFTTAAVAGTPPGLAPVASLVITPNAVAVPHYSGLQLTATTRDALGNVLTGRDVTWTSSNQLVAAVSLYGFLAGSEPGPATITAMSEGIAGTAVVAITPDPIAAVEVTPNASTILTFGHLTESQVQLTATPRNAQGAVVTGRQAQWTSSDNSILLVTGTGLVRSNAVGTATITATVTGVPGTATVTVVSAPPSSITVSPSVSNIVVAGQTRLTATVKDAAGVVLPATGAQWASSNPAVATVSNDGWVSGHAVGTTTIAVTLGSVGGTATVVVGSNTVASVLVSPGSSSVTVNGETRLTATPMNAAGTTLTGHGVAWTSSNPAVVSVTQGGVAKGLALGTATIEANIDGVVGTATVVVVPPFVANVLSAGGSSTCALTGPGSAYCWGDNSAGQLGNGTSTSQRSPTAVVGGLTFSTLIAGYHACGLTTAGAAYCWGTTEYDYYGYPLTSTPSPEAVPGGFTFTSLAVGSGHACALTSSGVAYCWGHNAEGELGDGTSLTRTTPVAVAGGLTFTNLTAGWSHTCGITTAGDAYCWGYNQWSTLGDGTNIDRHSPTPVANSPKFTRISAGSYHTCALTASGSAYCWGYNGVGALGNGSTGDRNTPVAVAGGRAFTSVAAGGAHTCGVSGGVGYCWGNNFRGQLGDGTVVARYQPVAVVGGLTFASVTAGSDHTCGLTSAGTAFCWGSNASGELGDGSFVSRSQPGAVVRPQN